MILPLIHLVDVITKAQTLASRDECGLTMNNGK